MLSRAVVNIDNRQWANIDMALDMVAMSPAPKSDMSCAIENDQKYRPSHRQSSSEANTNPLVRKRAEVLGRISLYAGSGLLRRIRVHRSLCPTIIGTTAIPADSAGTDSAIMTTFEHAKHVKKRYSAEIIALPNVTGVSTGRKVRNGSGTDEFVIVVYVSRKVPLRDLADHQRIADEYDGVRTQVRVQAFEKRNDTH